MNTLQTILTIVSLVLAYPIGLFIASQTKEELKSSRIWFQIIIFVSMIGVILSAILFKNDEFKMLFSCFCFAFLMAFGSFCYGENEKAKNKS